MTTLIFLWSNAILYAIFSIWCTVVPNTVQRFLGLEAVATQGRLEFLTIYGGLQFGLGAAFAWCALVPAYRHPGLIFGLCLYGGIVAWRTIALIWIGIPSDKGILGVYALEVSLLGLGIFAWYRTNFQVS